MPTDKQVVAYLNREIKKHTKDADNYRDFQRKSIGNSAAYAHMVDAEEYAVEVLEGVRDFVQGGKTEAKNEE